MRIQPTAAPEHPGLTREMLLAVVLLLCANIATVCSGIALVAYGTRSGQKAVLLNKIFEGSDYEATVFDDRESGDGIRRFIVDHERVRFSRGVYQE